MYIFRNKKSEIICKSLPCHWKVIKSIWLINKNTNFSCLQTYFYQYEEKSLKWLGLIKSQIFKDFQGLPKNAINFTEWFLFLNPSFSLSSKLSLDTKTSQCFITENTKENLFNWKYYLTKGILQFTVFFDHPVPYHTIPYHISLRPSYV